MARIALGRVPELVNQTGEVEGLSLIGSHSSGGIAGCTEQTAGSLLAIGYVLIVLVEQDWGFCRGNASAKILLIETGEVASGSSELSIDRVLHVLSTLSSRA